MSVRTRIAPSPTGDLHVGHLRTILYDYALAKKAGGQFIVRIEDTDRTRFVEGSMDRTLDVISAYGLNWDEGPRVGGDYGPYIQSERLEIYKNYASELIEKGLAYYCFLTPEETKDLQEASRAANKKLRSPYRDKSLKELEQIRSEGKPYVIRLKVPENREIEFEDLILGRLKFNTSEVDDQVLIKSDGFPTYHLAVVIDDHLMKINYILRGNDWLSSTPKHILLYEAFGWSLPKYAHLPNLKEKGSGKKLSKRFGAVFAIQFLEDGYLPEAMLNFLMLLGWSSPEEQVFGQKARELYSLPEFVELFSMDRVHKTALVSFDRDKLIWFNKEYLKQKDVSDFEKYFISWLEKFHKDDELFENIKNDSQLMNKLSLVKDRISTLKDVIPSIEFFYNQPVNIDWNIKQLENIGKNLSAIRKDILSLFETFTQDSASWKHEDWEIGMRKIGDEYSAKHGDVFMVLRVAMTGSPFSPPLFEALQILGKEEIVKRLKI